MELEQIVRDDLVKAGFDAPPIVSDGRIHRFKRHASDKNPDAWYVCFVNKEGGEDFLAGAYGDWSDGEQSTFCTHISLPPDRKKKIFQKLDRQLEKAQMERWEESAKDAQKFWDSFAVEEGMHAYLVRKKIQGLFGARLTRDTKTLLIPVRDVDGKMWGYQKIDEEGKKLFHAGTRKKSNFHSIADRSLDGFEKIFICEGFATGVAIHQATAGAVVVAFDAGNLAAVGRALRERLPEVVLVFCADDDLFTENNPGLTKAQEAAAECLGSVAVPKFKSRSKGETDFQDLAMAEGLEAVREQILGVEAKLFYVKCLGFHDASYFYTTSDNQQVTALTTHSEAELARLMPLDYWKSKYPGQNGRIGWSNARFDLTAECRRRGIFTRSMIRGNGVWVDQGKKVVHLGDRLFYDGKIQPLHSLKSKHIYELDRSLPDIEAEVVTEKELERFRTLLMSFNYSEYHQYLFLGGWMALAPICGALRWRPHIWLTGEPGTGKTTLKSAMEDYLKNSFRGLFVTGATTEAGIRQSVKASAFPLIFDEFEPEKKKDRERIDGIMDLIRQASSEQDGEIIKGSAGGSPNSYSTRFMAAVSSVKPRLIAEADKSRFTYVELVRDKFAADTWPEIQKQMSLITPEFSRRLFARSLHNIETTLKNIQTFHRAFVSAGNPQRIGQQYGTLLAGYYSLESDSEITLREAQVRIKKVILASEQSISELRDQEACLDFLMASLLHHDHTRIPLTNFLNNPMDKNKQNSLENYRMQLLDGDLWISPNNPQVDIIFKDSKWDRAWAHILKRLDGVNPSKQARFMGQNLRGILVPRSYFLEESDEDSETIEKTKAVIKAW